MSDLLENLQYLRDKETDPVLRQLFIAHLAMAEYLIARLDNTEDHAHARKLYDARVSVVINKLRSIPRDVWNVSVEKKRSPYEVIAEFEPTWRSIR